MGCMRRGMTPTPDMIPEDSQVSNLWTYKGPPRPLGAIPGAFCGLDSRVNDTTCYWAAERGVASGRLVELDRGLGLEAVTHVRHGLHKVVEDAQLIDQ